MRRRDFIRVAVGLAAAFPFAARAQQVDRIRRIGVLKGLPAVEFLHPRVTRYQCLQICHSESAV
jgi:hypothetical protein